MCLLSARPSGLMGERVRRETQPTMIQGGQGNVDGIQPRLKPGWESQGARDGVWGKMASSMIEKKGESTGSQLGESLELSTS